MSSHIRIDILKTAWDALGRGDMDAVASAYNEDMLFVIPGQNDILRGRTSFRSALDSISDALPPGFEITELRYFAGENENEFVNIVKWKSAKVPGGSQSAVLWKFSDSDEITEERWFVDTEQWKAAF
jgi:hypothetical protein